MFVEALGHGRRLCADRSGEAWLERATSGRPRVRRHRCHQARAREPDLGNVFLLDDPAAPTSASYTGLKLFKTEEGKLFGGVGGDGIDSEASVLGRDNGDL